MPYDPFKHHRRSIRLKNYDYAQAGAYFVTIVIRNPELSLGNIVDGEMRLNKFGAIVQSCWDDLPAHFPNVELDAFVVMPNHVHGVVVITDDGGTVGASDVVGAGDVVGAQHAAPLQGASQQRAPQQNIPQTNVVPGSLGTIVRSFKSAVTKRINELRGTPGAAVWQRNYFEHIVRNEKDLARIRKYIDDNPANWAQDDENPAMLKSSVK